MPLSGDYRIAWNIVDRLFRIKFAALAAGFGRMSTRWHLDVQQPQLEHREKAGRSGADDNHVGLDQLGILCSKITREGASRAPRVISIIHRQACDGFDAAAPA